jgi:hypothetical protein
MKEWLSLAMSYLWRSLGDWIGPPVEDVEDEEEDEDANDGGDVAAPLATAPPPHARLAVTPEEVDNEGSMEMIPEREAPVLHEVILADAELEIS